MTVEEMGMSVSSNEQVARFILYGKHLRENLTVKPDAFIPHPRKELSVTRHLQLSESQLWDIGRVIAKQRGKTLHGRADVQVAIVEMLNLRVIEAPIPGNSNHANITGWPPDKPAQKMIAQEIAAVSRIAHKPPFL